MATVRKSESQGALNASDRKVKELIGYVSSDLDNLVKNASRSQMDLLGGQAGQKNCQRCYWKLYKEANCFCMLTICVRDGGHIKFIDKVIKSGEKEATGASAALRYARLAITGMGAERLEKMRRQFTSGRI